MKSQAKNWQNTSYDEAVAKELQNSLKIHPVFCQLLVQRGIEDYESAKQFFRPAWEQLHDPFLMLGMQKSVQRLLEALVKKQTIVVYGDYDVDGTTSVALVYKLLRKYHQALDLYVPDRYQEGYGLSLKGVEWAATKSTQLMIVLDCGIKGHEAIARANELEIDVIVCDHHLPDETLPAAYAILNPKQRDCPYPYKQLSGCAIGFKFMQAFVQYCNIEVEVLEEVLDLVAISLACDYVALTGENRVLMYLGLQKLNNSPSLGVAALQEQLQRQPYYTVRDIVFGIGPPINAAGRLADARLAIQLLLAKTPQAATDYAVQLTTQNTNRRAIEQQVVAEAFAVLEAEQVDWAKQKSIVVYQSDWHQGVVGIVAARLVDHYYRPSIVLTLSEDKIVGSARTAGNFDIHQVLEQCQDLLLGFGGHQHAAGLSLAPAKLGLFIDRFEEVVQQQMTSQEEQPIQRVDATLELEQIDDKFWHILRQFEPFGPQNMRPVFASYGVVDTGYSTVVKEEHIRLKVKQKNSKTKTGIAFRQSQHFEAIRSKEPFDMCYVVEENTYKNKTNLQMNVRGIVTGEIEEENQST